MALELTNAHTLEEVQEIFTTDRFATQVGCRVVEAGVLSATCEMEIADWHRNGWGAIMGGAIFTLADFTMAVASNGYRENIDTVGVDASIYYMKPAKGTKLIAVAKCMKPGKILSFWEVDVTDDLGTAVAKFSGKTYTRPAN